MAIYLFCFASSCMLIYFGQKIKYGQYELFRWFVYGIALIIPAALAGLRDFSIGRDTLGYGNSFFFDVVSSPGLNAVSPMWSKWIEPGYAWLNFIVAKFTSDVRWFYFWIMLLQNIFVFLGFYAYRSRLPIWLGMLCYYFIFFNNSLNMIRQNFAISIIFFASCYLLNKSYMKYAIWILVAFFFHKIALLAFILIPLHIYISKFESDKAKFILITGLAIFFILLETFLVFFSEIVQIDYLLKGLWYLSAPKANSLKMSIGFLAALFPPFIFFYWKRKELYSVGKENHFFFIIAIICLLSTQLMWIAGEFAGRITDIFRWYLLLALPMTIAIYKDLPGKQFLLKTSIACYAVYYWFLILVYRNTDETFPYASSVLNSIF